VDAGNPDSGEDGAETGDGGGVKSDALCQPALDAVEPEVVSLNVDAGLPLDQVAHAYAVARCNYFSRCTPLAAYVLDECISALTATEGWTFTITTNGLQLSGSPHWFYPSSDLTQSVASGLVTYDERTFAGCVQALEAQSCHGDGLWESIPACANVFTPSSDGGVSEGGSPDAAVSGMDDGGSADGFLSCGQVPWVTCSTAADCVGVPCPTGADCAGAGDSGAPYCLGAPYCVDGYCVPWACSDRQFYPCSRVAVGEPCDADPPFLGNSVSATPWHTLPTKMCGAGFSCRGLAPGMTFGVCAPPEDVGGTCVEGAVSTGCRYGLVCQCGTCQIPPTQGPCASGTCKIGTSYCRSATNTCAPVNQLGGDCSEEGAPMCLPELWCDINNVCAPIGTTL
jgi:hypothetical protein